MFLNNISITDMDSVKTQAGMLAMITSQTDEISRATEVNYLFFRINPNLKSLFLYFNKKIVCCYKSMH